MRAPCARAEAMETVCRLAAAQGVHVTVREFRRPRHVEGMPDRLAVFRPEGGEGAQVGG